MKELSLKLTGELPPFYKIADFVWGEGSDFDSDGNSSTPEATDWSELTLILRNDASKRIDIDPIDGDARHLKLMASNEKLANSVVSYLQQCGTIK